MIQEIRRKLFRLCHYCVSTNNGIYTADRLSYLTSINRITTSVKSRRRKLTSEEVLKSNNNNLLRNRTDSGDIFGNIDYFDTLIEKVKDDPEDIQEYERYRGAQGKSMSYYINEIIRLLSGNEYQKALQLLEKEMVKDRKPQNNYICRLFLSYNAKIGDIKESYRLYTNFKKCNGLIVGGMYTSLFNACANCKNSFLALEKAQAIKEFMENDKNHTINLSNYNAMLKAFGRHGDLPTCLKIVDEVLERRDKVKAETYCFLLQACASDRNSGLRHALITWRKMLQNRCAPSIYHFNIILRCVRDCFLGDVKLLNDFVENFKNETKLFFRRKVVIYKKNNVKKRKILKIPVLEEEAEKLLLSETIDNQSPQTNVLTNLTLDNNTKNSDTMSINCINNNLSECQAPDQSTFHILEKSTEDVLFNDTSQIPNFLSLTPTVGSVVSFGSMTKPHERLLCIGGLKGFLNTMNEFGIEPDIKTFTLLLSVISETEEAEEHLIAEAKSRNLKLDTGFFNVLIKRRCIREGNLCFQEILKKMQSAEVSPDLITFGVLALGCTTHESGIELIKAVRHCGFRVNSEILGALLQRADKTGDMNYVKTIMDAAKEDQVTLSPKFIGVLGRVVRKEKQRRLAKTKEKLKDFQLSAS